MKRAEFYSNLIVSPNDEVTLEIKAVYKQNERFEHLKVYEEYENGTANYRCLYLAAMGGYYVVPIGEKYYTNYIETGEIYETKPLNISLCTEKKWYLNINKDVINKYPYLFKKLIEYSKRHDDITPYTFIRIIKHWKAHPSAIEQLIEYNQINLAFSKQFWKLSNEKQKEIINYIKNNYKENPNMNLKYILIAIKNNCKISYKEISQIMHFNTYKLSFESLVYCENKNISDTLYKDHIRMLKNYGKKLSIDYKSKYWVFPSDFNKIHQDLIEKINVYKENLEKEKFEKINCNLKKISNSLPNKLIENYNVYVPNNYEDIKYQAKELNQCLISCEYYKKMAEGKLILIFIRDLNNKPLATAEVTYKKEIKQFYANEKDRNNCKPSKKIANILNQYLEKTKIKKIKLIS